VCENGKYTFLQESDRAFAYLPLAQNFSMSPMIVMRGRGSAAATLLAARQELGALDPNIALERPEPLQQWVDKYVIGQRVAAKFVAAFGLVGLVLSAAGIYALLAFGVTQRSREFGIRMALGAPAGDVMRLVLRHAAILVGAGAFIGLAGALAGSRLIASYLFGLNPSDPVAFIAAPVILAIVALAASVVPVRRATAADPMAALRSE
jgi:putative ABC transport system permease protein